MKIDEIIKKAPTNMLGECPLCKRKLRYEPPCCVKADGWYVCKYCEYKKVENVHTPNNNAVFSH